MVKLRVAACLLSLSCGCAQQAAAPVATAPAAPAPTSAFGAQVSGYGPGSAALEPDPVRPEEQAEDPGERRLKLAQARAAGCGVGLR